MTSNLISEYLVSRQTGLDYGELHRLSRQGRFPAPIERVGGKAVWRRADVEASGPDGGSKV